MSEPTTPIAIVGVGAILPDAPDVAAFWANLEHGRYSISDVQPDRWDPALYYDADPKAPGTHLLEDRRLGPRVAVGTARVASAHPAEGRRRDGRRAEVGRRRHARRPRRLRLARPRPRRRAHRRDPRQRHGGREALPDRAPHRLPRDRARSSAAAPAFSGLPSDLRAAITAELHGRLDGMTPDITEDTMPGELGNCIAGRVANLFDLHGPNFVDRRRVRVGDGRVRRVDRGPRRR